MATNASRGAGPSHRPGANPRKTAGSLILLLIVMMVFPFIASQFGNSWVRIMDIALLYIMLALGLNVVVGFAGLLDLGKIKVKTFKLDQFKQAVEAAASMQGLDLTAVVP